MALLIFIRGHVLQQRPPFPRPQIGLVTSTGRIHHLATISHIVKHRRRLSKIPMGAGSHRFCLHLPLPSPPSPPLYSPSLPLSSIAPPFLPLLYSPPSLLSPFLRSRPLKIQLGGFAGVL